jgi:hypothetical protein
VCAALSDLPDPQLAAVPWVHHAIAFVADSRIRWNRRRKRSQLGIALNHPGDEKGNKMEKRLRLLETTPMQGSDGQRYVVRAYEHQAAVICGVEEHWEPTGLAEYKLDSGRHVRVDGAGRMTIAGTDVTLSTVGKPSKPATPKSKGKAKSSLPEHARP